MVESEDTVGGSLFGFPSKTEMSAMLERIGRVFARGGRVRAGWRFALLVLLYWACGPVLNPVLERMHFPDRGMTAGSLALNEGLDFVLIGFFSWIIARLGRERFQTTVSRFGAAGCVGFCPE